MDTLKCVDGRANHVDRVTRAITLGQDVPDASAFEHSAHCATGDDTRTFRCRLHVHVGRAMAAFLCVLQGLVVEVDLNHAFAGRLHRLLDGNRHFTCLAVAEADVTVAVAHDGQSSEAELTATLHDLRYTID